MKKVALVAFVVALLGAFASPAAAQVTVSSVAQLQAAVTAAQGSIVPVDIRIKAGIYDLPSSLELSVADGVIVTLRNFGDGQVILRNIGGRILRTGFLTRRGSYFIKGLTLSQSEIAIEHNGGAIHIEDTTFFDNILGFYADNSQLVIDILNSTFWENGTRCGEGSSYCGAIWLDFYRSATLTNLTVAGAGNGIGIYGLGNQSVGPTQLANSVFLFNQWNCEVFATIGATNNISDDNGSFACPGSTIVDTGFQFPGFGDHGGLVPTWPLTWDVTVPLPNPAIQGGDPAFCPPLDARGAIRRSPCDIGAYEADPRGFSLESATGTGAVRLETAPGLAAFTNFHAIDPNALPPGLPPGVTLPFGVFEWTAETVTPGQSLPVTITFPSAISLPLQYWKFDPASAQWSDLCLQLACAQPGTNQLSFTISDGGVGDADGIVNGIIVDPGGLGTGGTAPPPNVTLTKSLLTPATVGNGAFVTYRLTASNQGAGPTTGSITIRDSLDLALTFLPASSDARCTAAGQDVTCVVSGPLASGSSEAFVISVQVSADAAAAGASVDISNTASVETPDDPSDNTSNTVRLTVNGPAVPPELTITKDLLVADSIVSTLTVINGDSVGYRLSIANSGGATTGSVTVTDTLDPRLSFVAAMSDSRCVAASQLVTCVATGVAAAAADQFDIGVQVASNAAPAGASVQITNTAGVATANESNAGNNTSNSVALTVNGPAPNLAIAKSVVPASGIVNNGDTLVYRLAITNHGNGPTTAPVVVTDTLDPRLSFIASGSDPRCGAAGQQVTCSRAAAMASGSSDGFNIAAQVAADAASANGSVQISNTASVATANDSNTSDNTSNAVLLTVNGPSAPNMLIRKEIFSGPSMVFNGDIVRYRIIVYDHSSAPRYDLPVVVTDILDPRLSFLAAGSDPRCSAVGQQVTCNFYSSGLGTSQAMPLPEIAVRVAGNAAPIGGSTTIANTATVSVANESDPSDDISTVLLTVQGSPAPNVALFKEIGGTTGTVNNGDGLYYRLRVVNTGGGLTTGPVTVTDLLDARLTFDGVWSDSRCSAAGQLVTCIASGLGAGQSDRFDITVQVASNAAPLGGSVQINNVATVSTPDDSTAADNTSNVTVLTVLGPLPPNAQLQKRFVVNGTPSAGPISIQQGANVTYRLQIVNVGAGPTHGPTVVTDSLDPRLSFVSQSSDSRCTAAGQVITCVATTLIPPGGVDAFDIVAHAGSNISPTGSPIEIFNSASVSTPNDVFPGDDGSNTVALGVLLGAATPDGVDVSVQPTDGLGNPQPITLSFNNVTSAGFSTAIISPAGPSLPPNFQLQGQVYDITTTAQHDAIVTVCFSGSFLASDRLLHYENGAWVELSSQQLLPLGGPYTGLCAVTTSLSPFAVGRAFAANTPPSLALPANINAEASSAAGAIVMFTASATDAEDGSLAASCTPSSGAMFPFGVTTVNCTATDSQGASASGAFTVTVADTTPPMIATPGPITQTATTINGAAVSFTATANDMVSGSLTPTCSPASGSVFSIGTTTVTCSAQDAAGNLATAAFTVTVLAPDNDQRAPTLTRITPDGAKRGTLQLVLLQGTGLRGKNLSVRFSGQDITVIEEVSINATTAAALVYIKPNAKLGPRTVTVSTALGTSNAVTFVVR